MAHTKVTKTYSQNTGAANTFSYSGSFDVFKGTEVECELDNVQLTFTASTINESASPREYTVDTSAKTVHIGGDDLSSGTIIIRPVTDMGTPTPRATYAPGASVTAEDLNNNQLQLMRKALEYDEQKLSSIGGTMTGHLTMGEDQTIIFEGATDDEYETTLTVADPTADRTITLPNITGTVITTGDTGSVATGMIADDAVNNDKLANSIVSAISANTAKVTNATHTGDVTGSTSLSIASGVIVNDDINTSAAIAHSKLANVTDGQILVGNGANVPTAVAISGDVTLSNTGAITIATGAVEHDMLGGDCIDSDNIQDDEVDSEHIAAGAIDTEHINDANVTLDKIENISNGQVIVGNGSNRPTAVAMSGDIGIAASGATTIQTGAVEIGMLASDLKSTSVTNDDTKLPTSGAVVDYVNDTLTNAGSFEAIADEDNFPATHPDPKASNSVAGIAGMVISIQNAGGLQINSSGVATNARKAGSGSDDITINGFPSSMRGGVGGNADPYELSDETGLLVTTTAQTDTAYASGAVYDFHRVAVKPADYVQLSDDINDFKSRYRVAGDASGVRTGQCGADGTGSGSYPCNGDMYWSTGASKMYVYDKTGSGTSNSDLDNAWGEVTSVGDYKILTIKDHDQAVGGSGPTFNGSNEEFDLFDGSADASVTSAQQLIVSLNGVIQKPNSGVFDGSAEGYYLNDTHGIKFCDPPASGSSLFVTQIGSAVTLNSPADDSVTLAKMAGGTDGVIITYDANGDPVHVGPGTDGQVLTSTGAGSPPAFEDAAGGPSLANDANNRVITGTGSGLNGEANLTFDGSKLSVGHSDYTMSWGTAFTEQIYGNTWNAGVGIFKFGANTAGPTVAFNASRSTNTGTPGTSVANNDYLGYLVFLGDDGTDFNHQGAGIYAQVDGTPASNNIPGKLVFETNPGAANPIARLTIEKDGDVTIEDGNLKVASTHGIDFSDTGDTAGMTNELLDFYEEGTWTITDLTSDGVTFTSQDCTYTRVGRLVFIKAKFTFPNSGLSGTAMKMGGVPFPVDGHGSGVVAKAADITSGAGYANGVQLLINSTGIHAVYDGSLSIGAFGNSQFQNRNVVFSICYQST